MMTEPAIHFDDIWKQFRRAQTHDSLRDLVPAAFRRLVGRAPADDAEQAGRFWALQGVSFEVRQGQALGIIGHNGAGKSTVLKILTRILRPNRGTYLVRGRVGALIEVSAGFHPDLTGRENVFLQGAIMGMPEAMIRRRFDDIVDFAGVSAFIDTPVKRYSSGMNARLGFSIAAHLDPEVLIIDEVLAVGDFSFQHRAFSRVKEMVRGGIPVVIVSHQLDRIAELCTHAILLDHGEVRRAGTPGECVAAYLRESTTRTADLGEVPAAIEELDVDPPDGVRTGARLTVRVRGVITERGIPDNWAVLVRVRDAKTGLGIYATHHVQCGAVLPASGRFDLEVVLQLNVPAGYYQLESEFWDTQEDRTAVQGPSASLRVEEDRPFFGTIQMNGRMRVVDARDARVAATVGS